MDGTISIGVPDSEYWLRELDPMRDIIMFSDCWIVLSVLEYLNIPSMSC